jgi:putative Mg2+ transporter-C (MgtC) family protein
LRAHDISLDHQPPPGDHPLMPPIGSARSAAPTDEANIRALVAQSFAGEQFILRAVHSENLDPGTGLVQVEAKLPRFGRDNIGLEAAVSRLSLEPAVSSVSWTVENPSAALAAG